MTSGRFIFRKPWRIFSVIISAIMIVSITAPFTTRTAYALDIPLPLYPANYADTTPDSDPPLGIPSFVWSAVTGASKYRLQVDSEIGFNTPIIINTLTSNTSYTLSSILIADGEWYWRVRVEAPAPVGEWSEVMRFTKTWATSENTPTLLAPVDEEFLAFFNAPEFSWTPVMGAAKYRFQIASSPDGFTTPIVSDDSLTTSTQPEGD